ncbi:transporter substrate-binding domain-containing protein [Mesorhizobium sp. M3A.F.Ca.ET.201.01.1.1]|uniref:transporter substrate-binding domain-containing protein n=1 Tax=Mesorhizobium sp. M3A.F.Ca.ET.201.01.1.1 TaxID=2563946 RepID=UPI001093D143|nr:transporter substrate-binding domain-containing protein [Mesorhizobium sp. M3A.F.Ca.ET.201.01.1.1]TGS71753.1 transporter substrate-binding domain-containing protein [Mesorhizobium sp. M3A.F.Ca.ET.201.01.1.1]
MQFDQQRRNAFKLPALGLAAGAMASVSVASSVSGAKAQAEPGGLLRTILDRGHLTVGTGSTNAPWHFEDTSGKLVGMDIAMARILSQALFDDPEKVEYVREDPASRIPNILAGKVDVVIQFMLTTGARAQQIAFSRPYYVEGVALLTSASSDVKTFEQLKSGGSGISVSVLQNADADDLVHQALPEATSVQLDTQANVIQALDAGRVSAACVDLSTVRWLVARNPDRYLDSGHSYQTQLYGAGVRQEETEWLQFINTVFTVAIHGHNNAIYDAAFKEYFGQTPPARVPGFPTI